MPGLQCGVLTPIMWPKGLGSHAELIITRAGRPRFVHFTMHYSRVIDRWHCIEVGSGCCVLVLYMWSESLGQLLDSPVRAAAPELLRHRALSHPTRDQCPSGVSFKHTFFTQTHTLIVMCDRKEKREKLHMDSHEFASVFHLHVHKHQIFTSKSALQTCINTCLGTVGGRVWLCFSFFI